MFEYELVLIFARRGTKIETWRIACKKHKTTTMTKLNKSTYLYFIWLCCIVGGCKTSEKSIYNTTAKKIANTRILDSNFVYFDKYYNSGIIFFQCMEYVGFVDTYVKHEGGTFRTLITPDSIVYDAVKKPIGSDERSFGKDTIRYIVPKDITRSLRISNAIYTEIQDEKFITRRRTDTIKLKFEDSLTFSYSDGKYTIYKFSGRFPDSTCGTFFISDYFGVFKEYVKEENKSYQRQLEEWEQQFEIYWAHLYHMYHNPKFHSRCDNGPLWLLKTSYYKSDKPRCTCDCWPKN